MFLLADHDVYAATVEALRNKGHDVVTAKELGMSQVSDEELLWKAGQTKRLLLTRDKDFGALAFFKRMESGGIIFLRVIPSTVEAVHQELWRVFEEHSQKDLEKCFCVVEPHRHRIRPLRKSVS